MYICIYVGVYVCCVYKCVYMYIYIYTGPTLRFLEPWSLVLWTDTAATAPHARRLNGARHALGKDPGSMDLRLP